MAQTGESSPYSMFGYGSLSDYSSSSQRSMGGVGYATNNGRQINVKNPASYAHCDSLTFLLDFGMDFTGIVTTENGVSGKSFGGGLDYVTMQFPLSKKVGGSLGLLPYSSNGILNSNNDKFDLFSSSIRYKDVTVSRERVITTYKVQENAPNKSGGYVAFDVFLKNVTGSPYDDNLYLIEGTGIEVLDDKSNGSDGNINSLRMGFLKMDNVSKRSSVSTIQNIGCNNDCISVIYEPNSLNHSKASISRALKYNVKMEDGKYTPTFAVIKEGTDLEISNGHEGSNYELDSEHFVLQKTITDFDNSIFSISNGITKVRIYLWIEGQDMDSLESNPMGSKIAITINFYKDLAGYYQ